MEELHAAIADQVPGNVGALISEMDWREELHYWLFEVV
jgi:hypothetical protein